MKTTKDNQQDLTLKKYSIKIYLGKMNFPLIAAVTVEATDRKQAVKWVRENLDVR